MTRKVLFVDIDGVLHRGNSYVAGKRIVSGAPSSIKLFEYLPVLDELLSSYPDIDVVLSSDWAYRFGVEPTLAMLPDSLLRKRATAATYQGCEFDEFLWPMLSRGAQVLDYVRRHSLDRWLAVDDRRDGFETCRERLVHCQSECGLGDRAVVELLRRRLHQYFS
ncbi:HAD domain-containing protein [Paraburkholderia humisilvae]|uniref:HAD domain-containing protein n=1 Tax=Paraburkholderia humisilvae TaxID=627669 RepID=UPI001FE55A85|nr:HAD domain-containing protein [Paraburkholderia humisilvae]